MGDVYSLRSEYSGRVWQFNEHEDEALSYLPHVDQVLYLRGLRKHMDFDTGIVGQQRKVSYQQFKELLEVHRRRGSTRREPPVSVQSVRSSLDRLATAGLVVRMPCVGIGDPMIFRLPLAHLGSIRRQEEQQGSNTKGATRAGVAVVGFSDNRAAKEEQGRSNTPQIVSNNSTNVECENSDELFDSSSSSGGMGNCPHQEILALWQKHWPGKSQPNISLWAKSEGAKHLRARWREAAQVRHSQTGKRLYTDLASGLEWWDRFLGHIASRCPFLHQAQWFEFRWLIKPTNFAKALEGKYEDG